MGALLNMTAAVSTDDQVQRVIKDAIRNIRSRGYPMRDPQGDTPADLADVFQAYEFILTMDASDARMKELLREAMAEAPQHLDDDERLDASEPAQARAAEAKAAAEEASWRRRTGPEVWWDRKTDRERRAAKMQTRVIAGIWGAGILAFIEVILVLAVAR